MRHLLGDRLSTPQRVLLIAACAALPVVLLLFMFLRQTEREYRFTAQELKGAAYIAQIWPAVVSGGDVKLPTGAFGAEREASAFASAPSNARVTRAADYIQAVADGSNLTLDTDLSSFYAMDAATVGLPRLLAAIAPSNGTTSGAFALGRAQALEEAALRDLDEAVTRDRTGLVAKALAGQSQNMRAAFAGFIQNSGAPAARARLAAAVDQAWRADDRELARLLEARQETIRKRLVASLGLIILTVVAATALAAAMTRDMTGQLQALLDVVDRLNAGDTDAAVPYLQDRTEAGRIARTLEAFRLGLIQAEAERRRVEAANAAVHESEARYRMLADNSSDIILQYNAEFQLIYISPSVREMGYVADQISGEDLFGFVHPSDLDAVVERRALAAQGVETRPLTARLLHADGRWLWFEGALTSLRDGSGAVAGFVSTFRNIHERKLAEEALIDSEARYRMLAESITDVMLRYDADLCIQYVSPSVRQWGYAPDDFIGQKAGVFVHPDDLERVAERRTAMLAGERVESVETRMIRADGSSVWVESKPSLIRDAEGTALGVVLVMRDISQRKAAEQALVDSEARYRMLADNTSDIIQRFNADGIVEYMSPSVRQLGYEPEFFLGRPIAQLVDSEDREAVMRRREELLSGRPVPPLESRMHSADGRMVWLESRPSPILDEHGKLVGVVNAMRDITARKTAEIAMQELSLELRRVARASALGAFAASLAHEINQPLAAASVSGEAAMRWFSAEPPNYERGLQATRRMVEDVRRAADVVGRMRALVTKEAPKMDRFDAHEALKEVMALIARECERSSVATRTRLDAEDPWICGDRVLFQQVMINLILNAIEAMRSVEGERLLLVSSHRADGRFEFQVEDRGPGIEEDQQSRIFESMFTTKVGGTGLGLAISKSIVESHGGVISVTAANPRGAIFSVRLPVDVPATAEA